MVIQDLQRFLESQVPGACVPVDLLKIAKSVSIRRGNQRNVPRGGYGQPPLTLVVDGECCLDRLYGGFFSDWVCGGQWNRMVQFLAVLIQTVQSNNIELAVFFNGALEQQRLNEWSRSQIALRRNVNSILMLLLWAMLNSELDIGYVSQQDILVDSDEMLYSMPGINGTSSFV